MENQSPLKQNSQMDDHAANERPFLWRGRGRKNTPRIERRRVMLTLLFLLAVYRLIFLREDSALYPRKLGKNRGSMP